MVSYAFEVKAHILSSAQRPVFCRLCFALAVLSASPNKKQ